LALEVLDYIVIQHKSWTSNKSGQRGIFDERAYYRTQLKSSTSDKRTNHAAFFLKRCDGDIFNNYVFLAFMSLKQKKTKLVKKVKSYRIPKFTTKTN
jgi:hypothetical protein